MIYPNRWFPLQYMILPLYCHDCIMNYKQNLCIFPKCCARRHPNRITFSRLPSWIRQWKGAAVTVHIATKTIVFTTLECGLQTRLVSQPVSLDGWENLQETQVFIYTFPSAISGFMGLTQSYRPRGIHSTALHEMSKSKNEHVVF